MGRALELRTEYVTLMRNDYFADIYIHAARAMTSLVGSRVYMTATMAQNSHCESVYIILYVHGTQLYTNVNARVQSHIESAGVAEILITRVLLTNQSLQPRSRKDEVGYFSCN